MEVELFTEETSEYENYDLDDKIEDYLDFDGERCGICMDIVIDRGVLDCCQHWFCFACIDNWATITSLCPLCQNEFQLITCVPVYDTVGGDKSDEDTNPREDDWFVEEKSNTLSFPSYYIDENAVVCLDGDGCKIRTGSVAIEENSDIDTSIACDSCDKWYHAFCVGFDPDGTCDGSWLCPRCPVDKVPQKSELGPISRQNCQHGLEIASSSGSQVEDSFSGTVSVSLADDGETAVVVSLIEGHQKSKKSSEPVSGFSKDMNNTLWPNSISHMPESKSDTIICTKPNSSVRELGLSLSQDIDTKNNEIAKDHEPEILEANISSEECSVTADTTMSHNMEVILSKCTVSDDKEPTIRAKSAKINHKEANNEGKSSQKKIKTSKNTQPNCLKDQTLESVLEDSRRVTIRSISKDSKLIRSSQKENASPDIMAIVQGTDRRSLKQLQGKTSLDTNPVKGETASRLRMKKIMRRAGDDTDSSVLVQELREKIKETVRNKSCKEPGKNIFDPKLLDAFRAALAGPGTENRKQVLDLKAKQSMLQKGKTRESLTKKIYGAGGKRKRAWTRECEVEFWKHRCPKTSKTEKVETLKSVLDLLRDDSDNTKKIPGNEEQNGSTSILSRLYLADNSVFPRKNDISPVLAFNNAIATPDQKGESTLAEKICKSQPKNNTLIQVVVSPSDSKGIKKSNNGLKIPSEKEVVSKSDVTKGDKRKWALELLARKTAAPGKNGQEEDDDNAVLKENYPLLAKLEKDMRPVLAPARHNKISMSVRQAQLNRLTEHFLRKANLSKVCKTAEMELAVADAVNIEKEIADRSNSKLVYVNLCSQELLRRSKESSRVSNLEDPVRAKESNTCSNSEDPIDRVSEKANNSSLDLEVDEALRNAGLTSDSPPNSPNQSIDVINDEVDFIDEKKPDSILENDSHQDLDIYGDFEYNLEDDDFIGAGDIKISKLQTEEPKIKLVFSSLIPEKPAETLDHLVHEAEKDKSSCLLESQNKTTGEETTEVLKTDDGSRVQIFPVDCNEELSLTECEELYGPDKEPVFVKYPETALNSTGEETVNNGLTGDYGSEHQGKDSGQTSEKCVEKTDSNCSTSKELPSDNQKAEKIKKSKKSTSDAKHSENSNTVMKKVEAYIKEHIRPLCKSGVITVDQYRWAVGKTTEKVMKYHSKEKTANFLIKEGEKVKKLAEQYVEAAPTNKGKD